MRALLRSPCCLRPLTQSEAELTCSGCTKSYPLVEGIPVLIQNHHE